MGLPRGASVVDLGCGEGRHALELAKRFGFVVRGNDPVPSDPRKRRLSTTRLSIGSGVGTQWFGTERLEPHEAEWLWSAMRVTPASIDPRVSEAAIAAAGLLGDCLWHIYRMIGKLRPRLYVLARMSGLEN